MIRTRLIIAAAAAVSLVLVHATGTAQAQSGAGNVVTGRAAFGDFRTDAPGVRRHITAGDLPQPFATETPRNRVEVVAKPADAQLKVPAGFEIRQFAAGLDGPRLMRTAPNGDIFVAESNGGRIRVLRPSADGAAAEQNEIFATGLQRPYGIAFYPNNANPEWVYVGNTGSVVRFPYRNGDLKSRGEAEVVVAKLPTAERGHWTRDIVFSKDGTKMFVSVGSASNVAEEMPKLDTAALQKWIADHPLGAAWGGEEERAVVLAFDPQGKNRRIYAAGIRNCSGMAVHPTTGDLWCATNERDLLGDDLPPDYVTRVREGAFYGWPWYYIGANQDPRHKDARADLKDKITVPDVLIQSHSAALEILFYDGNQFPAEYKGDGFVALHGSWNRSKRTGYKVVRIPTKDGVPTGEYEDFVTGFGINDANTWGRPVGVAVAKDGALLLSEDGNSTIWRVTRAARQTER
jgi:glucose/arabinose dehydrogenase